MNSKNIKKHLNSKLADWLESIKDKEIKEIIRKNTIITGGALVSLLTGEKVHDYDVYFRTREACEAVTKYYVELWNTTHTQEKQASVKIETFKPQELPSYVDGKPELDEDGNQKTYEYQEPARIRVFIQSSGVAEDKDYDVAVENKTPVATESDVAFPPIDETNGEPVLEKEVDETKGKYRPVFLSSNAITLSDKIQIVIRFYGEVKQIHKNYDFAHCTCSWTSWDNQVQLPPKALECIINKELYYIGSKYPLCSIIRTRKYIERGYHINAGQYVKMAFQLNKLNLYDFHTLEDQLTGVDSGYFAIMIDALKEKSENGKDVTVDSSYVFELINRIF